MIIVGPGSKHFRFPKAILIYAFPVTKAALEGNFKEGKTGIMNSPEVSARSFELAMVYMSYLAANQGYDLRYDGSAFKGDKEYILEFCQGFRVHP